MDYWEYTKDFGDLASAFGHNGLAEHLPYIQEIVIELSGENDGPEWHWILMMKDGRWAYAHGGCDYTGWDCQSNCEIFFAPRLTEAIKLVPQDERRIFQVMLVRGEKQRDNRYATRSNPMGMSTHVVGIKPPDDKWKQMKAVWDACEEAGIDPPKEVVQYFGGTDPDDKGVFVELEEFACVSEYSEESQGGFEVDVSRLPDGVKIIRFYNSW